MRIIVLSDTHGSTSSIDKLIALEGGRADAFIHLGDYYKDSLYLASRVSAYVFGVKGNCDLGSNDSPVSFLEIEGVKIMYTHGHSLGVKYSLARITQHALYNGASLCLYGHTHIPDITFTAGVTLINPGSLSSPRSFTGKGVKTYAVINVSGGEFSHSFEEIK